MVMGHHCGCHRAQMLYPHSRVVLKQMGAFQRPLKNSRTIVLYVSVQKEFNDGQSGKKLFITIGHLRGLHTVAERMPCPENLVGHIFIIKGREGRGRGPSLSFSIRCHVSIISFPSRLGRGVFLSLHGQARSTDCFLCVHRVCPNLLSSLRRTRVSCYHCFFVWGHVSYFCCMLLLLCKPAWFCG